MRIERISENSIKCTLTSFDLSIRNLNLKELAYGSDKAKKLFDEMMARANEEVGFHVDNTPLMIEAIPSVDSIQLIISKVEDPEELDARFSKFSQNPAVQKSGDSWINSLAASLLEGAESFMSKLQKLDDNGGSKNAPNVDTSKAQQPAQAAGQTTIPETKDFRAFIFENLDQSITACHASKNFSGFSTLFKKPDSGEYVLVIESHDISAEEFARVCNIAAEYGRMLRTVNSSLAYFSEHYKVITKDQAIQKLGAL